MIEKKSVIVVFGSKVLADGTASGSLKRRVFSALEYSNRHQLNADFLVSGALGDHPPSEAEVMRDLLTEAGVAKEKIIMDEAATDTFDTILNSKHILSVMNFQSVYVCSDDYHVPRCWLLMRMLYGPCQGIYAHGSLRTNGIIKWSYYCLREAAAIVWDFLLAIKRKVPPTNIN